jgi:ArsR family transcriptional regulator
MRQDLVKIFKSLADKNRLEMVKYVSTQKEMSCQELMKKFSLSQPTLSHHFNKLIDAGVMNGRKDGVLWFYSINDTYLKDVGFDLKKLLQSVKG